MPKDKPVYIYCNTGDFSGEVAELLSDRGYEAFYSDFDEIELPSREPNCAVCGDHPAITTLSDYGQAACGISETRAAQELLNAERRM